MHTAHAAVVRTRSHASGWNCSSQTGRKPPNRPPPRRLRLDGSLPPLRRRRCHFQRAPRQQPRSLPPGSPLQRRQLQNLQRPHRKSLPLLERPPRKKPQQKRRNKQLKPPSSAALLSDTWCHSACTVRQARVSEAKNLRDCVKDLCQY
jgi:hypothetical protein